MRPRTMAVATSTPSYSSPTSFARASAPLRLAIRSSAARARRSAATSGSRTRTAPRSPRPPRPRSPSSAASRPGGAHDVVVQRARRTPARGCSRTRSRAPRCRAVAGIVKRLRERLALALAVDHVEREPDGHPPPAHQRAPSCRTSTLIQPPTESDGAEHRRQRQMLPPRTRTESGTRNALGTVGLAEAQHDHRQVGDRERDHRPEGEDPGQELHVGGEAQRRRPAPRRSVMATYGVRAFGVQPAHRARDLAVGGQRVGEPREAEHLAVQRRDAARPPPRPRPA